MEKKKSRGRGDHYGVGVKFICTQKWCMCRPWTTQLDPVSVNTDTPPSHTLTNTAEEETDSRPTLFFLFSPLLSLCCHKIYCIPFGRALLKLQVWSSLVTKVEDEERDDCRGALCVRVCEWFTVLCFLLCLWPRRSHLDCLLWPDYVMLLWVYVKKSNYDVMLSSVFTVL